MKEWNKYFIRSLDRDKLTRIMMYDARQESTIVRGMTFDACQTCQNLTESQKLDKLILDEDIIL